MRIALAGVALGGVVVMTFLGGDRPAAACSPAMPSDTHIGDWVARSPIIAIGRFENSRERDVTFVVEQEIKGASPGARLPVDNRTLATAYACSPYEEPFDHGSRYETGMRAVLMLEKQVEGLWQVSHLAHASFEVPESLDAPLRTAAWGPGALQQTDVRLSTILAVAGRTDFSLKPPGDEAPPSFANSRSTPSTGGANWLGVALGVLLFVAPIAWRVRYHGGRR